MSDYETVQQAGPWYPGGVLFALGWTVLGSGISATVFVSERHPGIVLRLYNAGMDQGWLRFIHWGYANGYAGTFTPRVMRVKRLQQGYAIAVMERLEHIGKEDGNIVSPFLWGYASRPQVEWERAERRWPGFTCFWKRMNYPSPAIDLSFNNVMVRGRQLVVTDPCFQPNEYGSTLSSPSFKRWTPARALRADPIRCHNLATLA